MTERRIKGRAYTEAERRAIVERVMTAWRRVPGLRLGQLIGNVFRDPYYVEDEDLAAGLESFAERLGMER